MSVLKGRFLLGAAARRSGPITFKARAALVVVISWPWQERHAFGTIEAPNTNWCAAAGHA